MDLFQSVSLTTQDILRAEPQHLKNLMLQVAHGSGLVLQRTWNATWFQEKDDEREAHG